MFNGTKFYSHSYPSLQVSEKQYFLPKASLQMLTTYTTLNTGLKRLILACRKPFVLFLAIRCIDEQLHVYVYMHVRISKYGVKEISALV